MIVRHRQILTHTLADKTDTYMQHSPAHTHIHTHTHTHAHTRTHTHTHNLPLPIIQCAGSLQSYCPFEHPVAAIMKVYKWSPW